MFSECFRIPYVTHGRWIGRTLAVALIFSTTPPVQSADLTSGTAHHISAPLRIAGKPLHIANGSIRFTGTLHTLGKNFIVAALGDFQVKAAALDWPAAKPRTISVTGFCAQGHLHLWHDGKRIAHVHIRDGMATFDKLRIKTCNLTGGKIIWSMLHHTLTISSGSIFWKRVALTTSGNYDLSTEHGTAIISIPNFQQQRLFALLVPQRVNVQGNGALAVKLAFDAAGHITGGIDLVGVGSGVLQLHQIPLLRTVLAGTYGQAMAAAMADDLHDYPFTTEQVHVTMTTNGMTFKLNFIRGPGNPMHLKPRELVIGGKKVIFRARDLKSVHLLIPVRNLTILKLLAMAQRYSNISPAR